MRTPTGRSGDMRLGNRKTQRLVYLGIAALAAIFILPQISLAGPPLICHPIDIGNAQSLPWAMNNNNWNLRGDETYDIHRVVDDTVALLNSTMPPLVRMETLRRATLYAQRDPMIAEKLLTTLKARALEAESSGQAGALAWFDAGYLVETYKQADWLFKEAFAKSRESKGAAKPNPAMGIDGCAWVVKAIQLRGGDAEMEFAAAIITVRGSSEYRGHREHLQKALAGSHSDALLAKNLATHFGGETS